MNYLYQTAPGGQLVAKTVDMREPAAVALLTGAKRELAQAQAVKTPNPATVEHWTEEVARLTASVAEAIAKQKPVVFEPLMRDNTRCAVKRYGLTAEQLTAYRTTTDGAARIVILAAIAPKDTKSNVGITRTQHAALLTVYPGRADLRDALSRGELIVPSDRAAKGAATKRSQRSQTEQTESALDFLFANVAEPEATTEQTDPATNG